MTKFLILPIAFLMTACPKSEESKVDPKTEAKPKEPPATAMMIIQQYHEALERNCGEDLPEAKSDEISKLKIPEEDQEKADKLLAEIGLYAQQCSSYSTPVLKDSEAACNPDCHWCPIKWYWCIENAGACAGGDNKSCCKLGACGSKHHCKKVCQSSCGCDVGPLPSDGGGGDDGE